MKRLIAIVMALCIGLTVSACGVKRDLKHPNDVQKRELKKQQRREGAI